MSDDIKEILEALRDSIDDTGTNKVNFINWVNKIEDYITKLQEENQYSDYCNEQLRKKIVNLDYKIEKLEEDNNELKERIKEMIGELYE